MNNMINYIAEDDRENDMEEEEEEEGLADDEKRKRIGYGKRVLGGGGGGAGGASPPSCQVENCGVDLTAAKRYHRRHKVCDLHAKAPAVVVAGLRQRFCQQCSRSVHRFHEVAEFDEAKRSCRRRLAGHNERRRKSWGDYSGEGSSSNKGGGLAASGNSSFKGSYIR